MASDEVKIFFDFLLLYGRWGVQKIFNPSFDKNWLTVFEKSICFLRCAVSNPTRLHMKNSWFNFQTLVAARTREIHTSVSPCPLPVTFGNYPIDIWDRIYMRGGLSVSLTNRTFMALLSVKMNFTGFISHNVVISMYFDDENQW